MGASSNKKVDLGINEILIVYDIEDIETNEVRLFGDRFVKRNKKLCNIIIKGKKQELSTHFNIEKYKINNTELKIKLIGINNITNISYMFSECISLSFIHNISRWNTTNITNISYMFKGCSNLSSLPNISFWNIENVTNMSGLFFGCSSLSYLPDISKWNTQNVTNMSHLFCDCFSLESLPDISTWNTKNVVNMNSMFYNCKSLESLPDISNGRSIMLKI